GIFYPVKQPGPETGTDKNNGKFCYFVGLYECNGFKKLIQSAETSRQYHKALGIRYKHNLSDKKVVKIQVFIFVNVRVVVLLKRQVYIESHRGTATQMCSFIPCFHNSGPATGNNAVTGLYDPLCDPFGQF